MRFLCTLCDQVRPDSEGAADAVERALSERCCGCGVCDACWAKLPQHVHEWAEERDQRIIAAQAKQTRAA